MKKSFYSLLVLPILFLTGCVTTDVYPGESKVKSRNYVNQSPEACKTIRFFCDEGFQPFLDDSGCGCEKSPEVKEDADDDADESDLDAHDDDVNDDDDVAVEEPTPVLAKKGEACGFISGAAIRCEESTLCASVEWMTGEPTFRCASLSVCDESSCADGSSCVIMESWPAIVRCVANPAEEATETTGEPVVEDSVEETIEDPAEATTEAEGEGEGESAPQA